MLSIEIKDYVAAIEKLITLALNSHPTTASEVAGEVILSLNNSNQWKLNICNLHLLDNDHYDASLIAIMGKIKFIIEPQYIIKNSTVLMHKLQCKYKHLRI